MLGDTGNARALSGDTAGTSGDTGPPPLELEAIVGLTAHCPSCVAVSPSSPLVAYTAGAGAVLYDWSSDSQAAVLVPAPGSAVRALACVAFSSDGRFLAGGQMGSDSSIVVWDVHSGEVMVELSGHAFSVRHVAFGPGDAVLLSSGSGCCQGDGIPFFIVLFVWRCSCPLTGYVRECCVFLFWLWVCKRAVLLTRGVGRDSA